MNYELLQQYPKARSRSSFSILPLFIYTFIYIFVLTGLNSGCLNIRSLTAAYELPPPPVTQPNTDFDKVKPRVGNPSWSQPANTFTSWLLCAQNSLSTKVTVLESGTSRSLGPPIGVAQGHSPWWPRCCARFSPNTLLST